MHIISIHFNTNLHLYSNWNLSSIQKTGNLWICKEKVDIVQYVFVQTFTSTTTITTPVLSL